jgi:Kef-type K+ transport system membrane component KefB
MPHNEISSLFITLFLILTLAKFLSELTRKFFKSILIGEILIGIILGPTLFGYFYPELYNSLINTNTFKSFIQVFNQIAVAMLLLIAGMESNIKLMMKQKVILLAGPFKIILAMIVSFVLFYLIFDINYNNYNSYIFIFSLGCALSITALPVLVRVLSEMNLYRTDFGMSLVGTAMFIDIIIWLTFSVIMVFSKSNIGGITSIIIKVIAIVLFIIIIVTIVRLLIDKMLPFIQSRFSWPDGIIAFVLALCFLFSGVAEKLGTHAIIGAFLTGLVVNDSAHFKEKVQSRIESIVDAFFAPIYFGTLGLQMNFIENINPGVTILFLLAGVFISVTSGMISYKKFGSSTSESIAFGFGLNTRGATDIIFMSVLLSIGIVNNQVYASYIATVLIVIILSPIVLRRFITIKYNYRFINYLKNSLFLNELKAGSDREAIKILSDLVAKDSGIDE